MGKAFTYVCGWISEETGQLRLSKKQLTAQAALPEDQCLEVTNSHVIIHPGKGFDDRWDLQQLMDVMVHVINILKYVVGI